MLDPLQRWRQYGEKPDYAGPLSFSGTPYSYHHSPGETLASDLVGPRLWELLRRAREAGVALVTGHQGSARVQLLDPVELAIDVTREADGALTVTPTADLPDGAGPAVLLGRPGHGLLLPEAAVSEAQVGNHQAFLLSRDAASPHVTPTSLT